MDMKSIEGVKAAESSLRRDDVEKLLGDVPEGHPVGDAVRKGEIGSSDLAGLPDGHPFIRALVEAKERMERADRKREDEAEAREVRMARRVEKRDAEDAERRRDEACRAAALGASRMVNDRIDRATDAMQSLADVLKDVGTELASVPDTRARALRLSRIADATIAGLQASRLRVRRV
jgi:hypothetical protein